MRATGDADHTRETRLGPSSRAAVTTPASPHADFTDPDGGAAAEFADYAKFEQRILDQSQAAKPTCSNGGVGAAGGGSGKGASGLSERGANGVGSRRGSSCSTVSSGMSDETGKRMAELAANQKLFLAVTSCLAWAASSNGLIVVNKIIMSTDNFRYPMALSSLGMVASSVLSWACVKAFGLGNHEVSWRMHAFRILPVGFFMAVMFYFGNLCYLYISLSFIQMLKTGSPIITMFALAMAGLEKPTPRLLSANGAWSLVTARPMLYGASAVMGFLVNVSSFMVIKYTSSLTLKILGAISNAVLVFGSSAYFGDQLSPLEVVGYSISLGGFVAYNALKLCACGGDDDGGGSDGGGSAHNSPRSNGAFLGGKVEALASSLGLREKGGKTLGLDFGSFGLKGHRSERSNVALETTALLGGRLRERWGAADRDGSPSFADDNGRHPGAIPERHELRQEPRSEARQGRRSCAGTAPGPISPPADLSRQQARDDLLVDLGETELGRSACASPSDGGF
ncbi:hypothetical protein T492DRAFT_1097820 [Pavlovales sp. CCMP2436]|nr:hypothetical protein T492DRAFT_1097820 [Pavlovales sp. CCMP2436]